MSAFFPLHLPKSMVEYIQQWRTVERHNAVKPVNDFKIKTLVGNYRAPSLERLTINKWRTASCTYKQALLYKGEVPGLSYLGL